MISNSAIIYPNVFIGSDVVIEDFCIIGAPFKGYKNEPTTIGDGSIIRSHTVIYAGNKIGKRFQTGNKANIRELNLIDDDVSVGTLSVIEHHVTIGKGVRIHTQVFVPEFSILEEGCWLGPNVVITNAKYPKAPNAKESLLGAHIRSNAKIGANATLLPGVNVGANSLVGAGSVVVRDVPDATICAGNPAKNIRKIHY